MYSCRNSPRRRGVRLARDVDRGSGRVACRLFQPGGGARAESAGPGSGAARSRRYSTKSLNFAVVVEGEDGFGRNSGLAVVQAPRSLPAPHQVCPTSSQPELRVLGHHCRGHSSPSYSPACTCAVATNQSSHATATCSSSRRKSTTCCAPSKASSPRAASATRFRLETAHDCPDEILSYLLGQFGLTSDDL